MVEYAGLMPLLLVIRSLAVYGGTAALLLFLFHRFVVPIRARIAIVLACAPLLLTGRAMLTGSVYAGIDILYDTMPFVAHREELRVLPDRTPSLADVVYQDLPWRAATRRALEQGRLPLWNASVLAGEPLLAVQQAGILQPGTWIGLLLPLPQAWTFDMALRLLIALVCAYVLLRDLGCHETASLLGAVGWAFSDFLVFFLGFAIGPSTAAFPLALLGVRRVVRAPGRRSVTILVVALVALLAGGHPETALQAGAAAGLYFLFELARAGHGRRMQPLLLALLASAIAVGLCAVLLLPLAEALPQTTSYVMRKYWYAHTKRSLPWEENLTRLVPQVVPYAVGVSGHGRVRGGFIEPSAYAGSVLFPLAFAGLFSRRRARWFFIGLGLLCLAICAKTGAADLITKLPLFDITLNERLVFLVTFSLCVLATFGADRLRDGEGTIAFAAGAVISVGGISWLVVRFRPRIAALEMSEAYMRERVLLQTVPLLLGILVIVMLSRKQRTKAGLAAVLGIFAAQRTLEAGGLNPTMPERTFYPPLSVLEEIPRETPYRMAALGVSFIPNAAAVYDLEDVRGYEAMTLRSLDETYPLWCVPQGIWFNRVDDPATPFLAFLNVRWVLAPLDAPVPAGWPIVSEADAMRLIENPRSLPRAFVPRLVRIEPDPARRIELLRSIPDFREQGIVGGNGARSDWAPNGEADVTIASYGPQTMELDVLARQETLVATSIPAWHGWRAAVDGQSIANIPYNHSFLAFRVPEGRHRLSLRYFSDATRIGLVVSGGTLTLCALILVWRAASRSR